MNFVASLTFVLSATTSRRWPLSIVLCFMECIVKKCPELYILYRTFVIISSFPSGQFPHSGCSIALGDAYDWEDDGCFYLVIAQFDRMVEYAVIWN
jgi:hypothetical protein